MNEVVALGSGRDAGQKNQLLLNSGQLICRNVSSELPVLLIFQETVKMNIFTSNFWM